MQSQQHVEQLSAADEKVRRLLDAREQVRLDEVQKLRRKLEVYMQCTKVLKKNSYNNKAFNKY